MFKADNINLAMCHNITKHYQNDKVYMLHRATKINTCQTSTMYQHLQHCFHNIYKTQCPHSTYQSPGHYQVQA